MEPKKAPQAPTQLENKTSQNQGPKIGPQKSAAGTCMARKQHFEESKFQNGPKTSGAGTCTAGAQHSEKSKPKNGPPKSATSTAMARKQHFEK